MSARDPLRREGAQWIFPVGEWELPYQLAFSLAVSTKGWWTTLHQIREQPCLAGGATPFLVTSVVIFKTKQNTNHISNTISHKIPSTQVKRVDYAGGLRTFEAVHWPASTLHP